MKDDYLWDGSGDPDPDVEHLEDLLARFRHQGRAPEMPQLSPRTLGSRLPLFAVAAALLIALITGLWLALNRQTRRPEPPASISEQVEEKPQPPVEIRDPRETRPVNSEERAVAVTARRHRVMTPVTRRSDKSGDSLRAEAPDSSTDEITDSQTAEHIESAQLFLRSFRNMGSEEGRPALDVSYEKERSRELLYRNIVLRRDAEDKGDSPISELLGELEPILLEIANLSDNAPVDDVRAIKDRVERREIVAALQIYSEPVLSAAFRQ